MSIESSDRFLITYQGDPGFLINPTHNMDQETEKILRDLPATYRTFLQRLPAVSFKGGALRVLTPATKPSIASWNSEQGWHADWPEWRNRFVVFAFDWLGNQIAFDRNEAMNISEFEPGTGNINSVPVDFSGFLDLLVDSGEEILLEASFTKWRTLTGRTLEFNQCVGHKIPLFLGGSDSFDNMEVSDLSVHVSIMGQVYRAAASKSKISGFKIGR